MSRIYCKDCIYTDHQSDPLRIGSNQLFCHRYPPLASIVPGPKGGMIAALCAPVTPEMWCGEGEASEEGGCLTQ
jgi:hypothetical protein